MYSSNLFFLKRKGGGGGGGEGKKGREALASHLTFPQPPPPH